MPAHNSGQLPLISRNVFETLQEDLQDPGHATGFCSRCAVDLGIDALNP
jgi:hypothetical protein